MDELNSRRTRPANPEEIDLQGFIRLLFLNYKLLLGTAFSFALIGALVSLFFLEPVYETTAVIIPARDQSVSSRLNSLVGSSPFSQFLNLDAGGNEALKYKELLSSGALVASVIEGENLLERIEVNVDPEDPLADEKAKAKLIKGLQQSTEIVLEGGFLKLAYRSTDPLLAYDVIVEYLSQLSSFIQTNIQTTAQSTEDFIASRLAEAEAKLAEVEAHYLNLQNKEGVVELPSQLGMSLNTASQLRSQLIEKEMEIEMYRNVIRDSGEIQRLEAEKAQIQRQLDRLVKGAKGQKKDKGSIEVFTPLSEGASLSFQFANAERDYLMQVKIVDLLRQQLELAQIETKKQEPMFQVIDPPVVGVLPVGPNKRLITVLSFCLGILIASVGIIFTNSVRSLPKTFYRIVKVDVREKDRLSSHS